MPAVAVVDHAALSQLVRAQLARATVVAELSGGWGVIVRYGSTEARLAAKRGQPRRFARADSAIAYLKGLGLDFVSVDAKALDLSATTRVRAARPDRSAALKRAHEAAAFDAWFREQITVGVAQANAGQVIDHDEHQRRADKRRQELLARTERD